jgi:glycosyltransferase involved in cell wall biosynthesis
MRVCHLTSVHARYDTRIFQKECRSLSKAGYEVSLIVADGNGDEIVDKIKIYDVGFESNRIKRTISVLGRLNTKALELDCEIYHFHDPELIFSGLKLKKAGKKVIFDMHENIPADISEKKYLPVFLRKLFSKIYEKLEIYAVKRLDGIVSTIQSVNTRLAPYNNNIKLVTNYPDVLNNIEKLPIKENILCFAGAIVPNWQHKEIIQALDNLENVKYLMAGPAEANYLEELKLLKSWSKVEYLGVVPINTVFEMYKKATIGMVIHIYCKNMDGVNGSLSNTKLFEFMNWEIPVICTDYVLWKEIVDKNEKCGICINPYNTNAISESINYLINNPELAKKMGKSGRNAVIKKYNWQSQEKILLDLYQIIINNNKWKLQK